MSVKAFAVLLAAALCAALPFEEVDEVAGDLDHRALPGRFLAEGSGSGEAGSGSGVTSVYKVSFTMTIVGAVNIPALTADVATELGVDEDDVTITVASRRLSVREGRRLNEGTVLIITVETESESAAEAVSNDVGTTDWDAALPAVTVTATTSATITDSDGVVISSSPSSPPPSTPPPTPPTPVTFAPPPPAPVGAPTPPPFTTGVVDDAAIVGLVFGFFGLAVIGGAIAYTKLGGKMPAMPANMPFLKMFKKEKYDSAEPAAEEAGPVHMAAC